MAHLTQLAQLRRRVSSGPTVSCNFFICTILDFLYQSDSLPFIAPTDSCTTAYSLTLGFGDEGFGFELGGKEGEEDLLLVEGFDRGQGEVLGAFDELVGLCHVEDELVADEFGGGVVNIGTFKGVCQNCLAHSLSVFS